MRSVPLLLIALCLVIAGCGGDDNEDTTGAGQATTETQITEPQNTDDSTTETSGDTDDSGGGGEGGGGGTLEVAADPGGALEYTETELTATAGEIEVGFENESPTPHDVNIERDGENVGKTEVITNGNTSTTVTLEAGEYTYYCSVGNHRESGMEGTLTVE